MSKRIALILNSHSLSSFQRCPKSHEYTDIIKLEPRKDYRPFKRGGVITLALANYYEGLRLEQNKVDLITNIHQFIATHSDLSEEDQGLISTRFLRYCKYYKNETLGTIAIEKGFSKVIYEDKFVYFAYEGTPDLVGYYPSIPILVMDHKSESRKSDIYTFNNQFLGYCFGVGTEIGQINYFGLQETGKPEEWFRRTTIDFKKEQIDAWKADTIKWFYRIAQARKSKDFLRTHQCEGKYGVCQFHKLCEITEEKFRLDYQEKNFKSGGRRHSFEMGFGEKGEEGND